MVGDAHYHPGCFICDGCQEPLGTQNFFIIDGKNYCAKDREVRGCEANKVLLSDGLFDTFFLLLSQPLAIPREVCQMHGKN